MRCHSCNQLSMRSCDVHNLQFESVYDEELKTYIVKPESIRLVCPKCGYEHSEAMKSWMNIHGGYIHEIPALKNEHPRLSIWSFSQSITCIELESYCHSTVRSW